MAARKVENHRKLHTSHHNELILLGKAGSTTTENTSHKAKTPRIFLVNSSQTPRNLSQGPQIADSVKNTVHDLTCAWPANGRKTFAIISATQWVRGALPRRRVLPQWITAVPSYLALLFLEQFRA
jgi:hypothetical protein